MRLLKVLRLQSSIEDLRRPGIYRPALAEFMGTFLLVFIGVASCMDIHTKNGTQPPSVERIALTFGLSVAVIVWATAHISGGHINPAVTLAMLLCRRISSLRAIIYFVAQMLGAYCGSLVLKATVIPDGVKLINFPNENLKKLNDFDATFVEMVITFLLVFTVFAACDTKRVGFGTFGPFMIGLSVATCHLAFVPVTGSGMNPARSFGPAVAFHETYKHWIYWVGPLVGGSVGGLLYETMFTYDASFHRFKTWLFATEFDADSFVVIPRTIKTHTGEEEGIVEEGTTEDAKRFNNSNLKI